MHSWEGVNDQCLSPVVGAEFEFEAGAVLDREFQGAQFIQELEQGIDLIIHPLGRSAMP